MNGNVKTRKNVGKRVFAPKIRHIVSKYLRLNLQNLFETCNENRSLAL